MKFARIALVVAVVVTLAGCGGNQATTTLTTEETSEIQQSPWGRNATFSYKVDTTLYVKVDAPLDGTEELDSYDKDYGLKSGERAWYVLVTITNEGPETVPYDSDMFAIYDSEDMRVDGYNNLDVDQPSLGYGDLPAGRSVTGAVVVALQPGRSIRYVDFLNGEGVLATWSE